VPARPAPRAAPRPAAPSRPAPPASAAAPSASPPAAAPAGAPPGPDDEQPVIRKIVFEGNLLYSTETMKTRLRNKEGRRLDPVALDADMKELYRYFKEIQVVKEKVPGGIILRFRVSENPLVVRLDLRGNTEIDDDELKAMLRTQEGYPLSPYQLAADRADVEEAYRLRGYHFAHVPDPDVITLPNGGREVVFTVVEGPKVRVDRILLRGNHNLSRKELLDAMVTEEPNVFEQIVGETTFRQDVLEEDIVALRNLYRKEGFLDAEVVLDDLRFSDDKSRVVISIAIDEHQPYKVGRVDVKIVRVKPGEAGQPTPEDVAWLTEDRLRDLLGLRAGERYSGKVATKGIEAIRKAYYARSYLDVKIVGSEDGRLTAPFLQARAHQQVVDVRLVVQEGAKFRLARIDFLGNEFTRDKILRREVKTWPGGYVDRNELEKGLTRIRRTNYFDRATLSMKDALDQNGDPVPGWKRAVYEVVEASTGRVSFGVLLSTNGGFGASVNFEKRNFDIARWPTSFDDLQSGRAWTGAGQKFDLLLAPNTLETQIRAHFNEPRLFGSMFSFDTSVYKVLEYWNSYDVDRTGYTLGLGYPIYENAAETFGARVDVGWRHELTDIRNIDANSIPGAYLFDREAEIRSVSGSLRFYSRDTFQNPHFETSLSLQGELTGTFLGGDIDMWSLSGAQSNVWTVHEDEEGKKYRLASHVTAALAEALQDTPEVPPYARFFNGGSTFRGFANRGLGPHVNGEATGGEWMLVGSLEFEVPLVKDVLSVVAFMDQGTLGTSLGDRNAWRWRLSVGGGLRLAIPFLTGDRPLALDLGFPILYENEDERSVLSFTIGRSF
jgi:outer membrane protein insertion porin family